MSTPEQILFITYLLLGPVAWLLLAVGMRFGRMRMNRLLRSRFDLPAPAPAVTVLIPAKDEGERVRVCLDSVLAQDYPNFDVIAVDDRSTDDTGRILDEIAGISGGKVSAIHVESLPTGWLGKCNALQTAAGGARGEWLLFVDSDVRLGPTALSAALASAHARGYDALSILTALECHTFMEKLVLPLAAGAWSIMNAVSLTNNDQRPGAAYANGQFLLVRRSAYDAVGGHAAVRDRITEDVELVRLMKAQGLRPRFLLGSHLASTRMHATLPQMFRGWGRIYSGTSRRRPGRILAAAAFVTVCGFGAYAALAWGLAGTARPTPWLTASIVHLLVMTLVLMGLYAESRNPRRMALMFPVSGAILVAIFAFAVRWCVTGRIEWRGTTFDQNRPDPAAAARG